MTPEYRAQLERKADAAMFAGSLIGAALIDADWRVTGWVVLFVSVACLFQRIRNLT